VTRLLRLLKRSLIVVHRWIGVALAVLFAMWFTSGIVMMYWSYPEVGEEERLARQAPLRPADVRVTVEDAYARLKRDEAPAQVLLTRFDGRPIYRFDGGRPDDGDSPSMVYADDGSVQRAVTADMSDRAAAQWVGRPLRDAQKTTVPVVDQWTIGVRAAFPLQKYAWPGGEQVYVDGEKASIVQYTTTASRFWSWLGAIPHWIYFTPIRRDPRRWFDVIVWTSGVGTFVALSGLVIAVSMLSPRRRYRHGGTPTSIPYRGWKRWHTIVGLCFGVIAATWVFSGLLSMGPFATVEAIVERMVPAERPADPDHPRPGPVALVEEFSASAPLMLSAFVDRPVAAALAAVPDFEVKELELSVFDGRPIYLATNGAGDTRVIPVQGEPARTLDVDAVMRRVRDVAGASLMDVRLMNEYDAYYLDRTHQRPLPVIMAQLDDGARTRYYIDPRTASIVGSYSRRGWVDRWLYHGLHSLDFPWLYKHRPLWDIVVLTLLVGGNALCVTSIVLAWRVLTRKVKALAGKPRAFADDDLVVD
jgi:hypothetical protein